MNIDHREQEIAGRAKEVLDKGLDNIDARTAARLREIRMQAADLAGRRGLRLFEGPRWLTAGGLASAVVLLVTVSLWNSSSLPARTLDDFEIVTEKVQPDVVQDLEFYRWLAEDTRKPVE